MLVLTKIVKIWLGLVVCFAGIAHAEVDYSGQIAPLLKRRCVGCHGPAMQRSGLRVDRRSSLLKGGDLGSPAIVPGHPDQGTLVGLLRSADAKQRMPFGGSPLPDTEIQLIETWIREGAVWPEQMNERKESEHPTLWSMQPVRKQNAPEGPGSEIDRFLLRGLSATGLTQSPRADARTLIRRASIVLTGLPPSPEEVEEFRQAFQRDPKQTYTDLIDRLLASPHFGERWAQHWLDSIRWAESNGSESNDFRKNAWPYRDYLIRAFNEDRPYTRFIRDQIAGDSTGEDAATGFLVAGPFVPGETVGQEASAQKQARFDRLDEIVQTVGASMMGMTIGCARCHNHKFDPISARDYYSMVAVFQDVEYDHRVPHLPASDPRVQASRTIGAELESTRAEAARYGAWDERWPDHREVHFAPAQTKRLRVTFFSEQVDLDELEAFSTPTSDENLALASHGTKVRTNLKSENPSKPPEQLIDDRHTRFWGWSAKRGDCGGQYPEVTLEFSQPETIARVDFSSDRFPHYSTDYLVGYAPSKLPAAYRIEVESGGRWREVAKSEDKKIPAALQTRLDDLAKRYDNEGPQPIFAGRFVPPDKTYVLYRGSPMDPREEAPPAGLAVIGGDLKLSSDTSGKARRLAFANWLTTPSHPLTARVMVNRLWQHVFGNGLVSTPADFGEVGGRPSHPELLDWLAATFVEDGWSVKKTLRRMLLTSAFQQASQPRPEALAVDADTRLLWRFPPRRLDAEAIRDGMLVAAGTLDRAIGGPSYRIHNVKKRYEQWAVVDNYGPQTWRRLIYQQRMRGIDDHMFTAFDYPDCAQLMGKRPVSTTPLQALNLMNGPLVATQSEKLAERVRSEAGSAASAQVNRLYMLVLSRPPSREELNLCLQVASTEGLPAVARALFNTNEAAFLQ